MAERIEDVKDRLSRKFLGRAGIHAIGVRRSENAITVYFVQSADPAQRRLLKLIESEASPYNVLTVTAPAAIPL